MSEEELRCRREDDGHAGRVGDVAAVDDDDDDDDDDAATAAMVVAVESGSEESVEAVFERLNKGRSLKRAIRWNLARGASPLPSQLLTG